ncbi:SGNH hydrolase-type esterase domain-containing protein [Scheffersomyces amazonensis]|uniref:SGNH hydrolase-type esterase domain-containing protein n=1 Tax=Scheffersomyces amazonensis TaxID=1078765 RepID=UPI00315D4398
MSARLNKFILFGDSVTQMSNDQEVGFGLHPALQNLYARKVDIINRGYNGYSSDHAKVILPKILEAELNESKNNVKLITIFFGTNDVSQSDDKLAEVQAVPLDRYKENLDYMIKLSLKSNIKPIVITPGFHDAKLARELYKLYNRKVTVDNTDNLRQQLYAAAAVEVAKRNNVAYVNVFEEFLKDSKFPLDKLHASHSDTPDEDYISVHEYIRDGIHFTAKAYKILFAAVVKAINENYPELNAESLPQQFTDWIDLDPKNVNSVLG